MTVDEKAGVSPNRKQSISDLMQKYKIGEFFQDLAVDHSRKSIGSLMAIRPDYAMVKQADDWVKVDPATVQPVPERFRSGAAHGLTDPAGDLPKNRGNVR